MSKRSIKILNCCYYDSTVHFEFEGIEINSIILFLALISKKNIILVTEGNAVVHQFPCLHRHD